MDLNEALENFFYYGFIVWFVFVVYLALGNGIIPLAFVEIPHPYQAAVHLPNLTVLSVVLFLFIFAKVTTEDEEHEKILAALFLASAIIGVVLLAGGTLPTPSIWTYLSISALVLILVASALNFWWKWRETIRSMMR